MALGILLVLFISGDQQFISRQYPVVIRARTDQKVILTEYFCIDCPYYGFVYGFVTFGEKRDQAAGLAFDYCVSI